MSLLVNKFRESVSKLKDPRAKAETAFDVGYSTGFLNFDFTNGTIVQSVVNGKKIKYASIGIVDGSISTFIGRAGCGKTSFAVQCAANIIRPYELGCIFHDDIEGGITQMRKLQLTGFTAEEIEGRYIHRNYGVSSESFYERIKMVRDLKMADREKFEYDTGLYDTMGKRIYKLQPTVYILDSLAMLMPSKYADEDELSGQMSSTAAAKANSMIFKRIQQFVKESNIILIIINHINQKVDINPMAKTKAQTSYLKQDETLPGGNASIYLSNLLIRFDDNTKLKENEGMNIDGNYVDLTLVKSRTNAAGKSATLIFDKKIGFDPELSLLLMLKQENKINGAGAFLYLGDRNDMKFSQKAFKTKLNAIPEFRELFESECRKCLMEKLQAQVVLDNVYSENNTTAGIMAKGLFIEDEVCCVE